MNGKGRKIVVGLSGGVDSSVALLLLKQQGWSPVGVSLKMAVWKGKCNEMKENVCCTKESFSNARKVCEKLGVSYYIYDVQRDFEREVIGYFLNELSHSRTPNPCLVCNRELKIKKLFEWARKHKIKYIATGHYANITRSGNKYCLSRAKDENKDQSYGLCLLPHAFLSHLILPLGGMTKQETYETAIKAGLGFFTNIKQSQDLCFVSERAMKPFLFEKLGKKPGPIIDESGKRIGEHYGLYLYTVGQRRGLGFPFAYFVKGFDVKKNALLVTRNRENVLERSFTVSRFNWLSAPFTRRTRALIQIRNHHVQMPALIIQKGKKLIVHCDSPIEGIAPGQICSIYKGRVCLGGGAIDEGGMHC